MLLLDAINQMATSAAQSPVNAVGSPEAARALNLLNREVKRVLTNGYPFNTNIVTLQVNTNGRVPLSRDYLKIRYPVSRPELSWRDDANNRYVWDRDTNDWHDADVEDVEVVFTMDFELIPDAFAQWIAADAASKHFANTKDGRPNMLLVQEARTLQAAAINTLDDLNVHGATGYNAIRGARRAPVIRASGAWITLG